MMMSHIQTETSEVKCHVASDKAQSRGRGGNRRKQDEQINNTNSLSDDTEEEKKRMNKDKEEEERIRKKENEEEDLVWWVSDAVDTNVHSLMKKNKQWGRLRSVWTKSQFEDCDVTVSHWTVMSPCPNELWCHRVPLLLHINSCEGQKEATYRRFHPRQFVPLLEKINCQHREDPRKQETLETSDCVYIKTNSVKIYKNRIYKDMLYIISLQLPQWDTVLTAVHPPSSRRRHRGLYSKQIWSQLHMINTSDPTTTLMIRCELQIQTQITWWYRPRQKQKYI